MKRFGLFLIFLPIGFALYLGARVLLQHSSSDNMVTSQKKTPLPTSAFSQENAPSQSIRGQIASISGIVMWQSRTATTPTTFTTLSTIQQGELLQTQPTGKVSLSLQNVGNIAILPSTELNFIQTLFTSVVLQQDYGDVMYEVNGPTPISIRTFNLLTKITSGQLTISVDSIRRQVTLTVASGSAQVAYNDIDTLSSITTIPAGKELTYDDITRETSIQMIK